MGNVNTTLAMRNMDPTIRDHDYHYFSAAPANGTVVLELESQSCTDNSITVLTVSGTIDVELRIDNVPVQITGGASATTVHATSSKSNKAAVSANVQGIGSKFEMVLTLASSPVGLSVTIHRTRND